VVSTWKWTSSKVALLKRQENKQMDYRNGRTGKLDTKGVSVASGAMISIWLTLMLIGLTMLYPLFVDDWETAVEDQ